MYSIKAITTLTGLTAETLRAWERRYNCVTPKRSASSRRSYSQNDLEKLTLLAGLTRNGHAISKIANLTCEQLRQFQDQAPETGQTPQSYLFEQILEALKHYRIERCEQLLKQALLAYAPFDYVKDVLLPSLHLVGDLWHQEKITVAQEHLFSNCIKRIVLTMINNLHQSSTNNPAMLFATPSGEQHEFGILLGCLIAAAQQYSCYYLGADLPSTDIIDACRHLKPDIVVIGMVKSPPEETTIMHLDQLLAFGSESTNKIWLAGAGAEYWFQHKTFASEYCELITDIEHFRSKARQQLFFNTRPS
ncbi:MAG: B12-binding domain-containing protein [Methylomonas sp.]|nr:B12-binding domain-containing protein [Methylomonas sp.]